MPFAFGSFFVIALDFGACFRTESDILAKLESVPNKSGYIKSLIRADIARECDSNLSPLRSWSVSEVDIKIEEV